MDPITAVTAAITVLNVLRQMRSNCKASHAEAARLISRCDVLYAPLEECARGERPIKPELIEKVLSALEYSKKQVTKFMDNSVKGRFDRITRRSHYLDKFRTCNQLISDCCQDINLVLVISSEARRQQDLEDQKLVLASILRELKAESADSATPSEEDDDDGGFLLEGKAPPVAATATATATAVTATAFFPEDDVAGSTSGYATIPAQGGTSVSDITSSLNELAVFEEQRKLAEEEARMAELFANVEREVRAREAKELGERLTGFAIRNHHGRYATATPEGELRWNATEILGWERFNAEILSFDPNSGDHKITIRSAHGRYLTAEPGGRWSCGAHHVGVDEIVSFVTHSDARNSLRGAHGLYMRTPGPTLQKVMGIARFISKQEEICFADSSSHCLEWERLTIYK